jgi:tetratricopeptide (TPR) repeat protein
MVLRALKGPVVLIGLFLLSLSSFAQQPSYIVQGSVVESSGLPASAALVEVSNYNGGVIATGVTDSGGGFTFQVSSPGPYEIQVITPQATQRAEYEGGLVQGLVIHLPAPEVAAGRVDAAHSVVSVNDLEASREAKSKLEGAQKAIKKSNWTRAWELVNQAIVAAPNWGRAYLMRGALSFNQHNYASAKADFAEALARNPKDTMALTELGKLYSATGDLKLSEEYLRRALANPPVGWPTYFELANLDLKNDNFSDAEKMTSLAMQCQPQPPPTIHFLAGEAAYHLGQWKVSKQEFERFLARNKPTPALAAAFGQAHTRLAEMAQMGVPK